MKKDLPNIHPGELLPEECLVPMGINSRYTGSPAVPL